MHSFEVGWGQLILCLCCADKDIDLVHLQHVPVQIWIFATQHAEVNLWWRKNYGLYGKGKRKSHPCPYHKGIWLHFLTHCRRATQKCVVALPCVVDGSCISTFFLHDILHICLSSGLALLSLQCYRQLDAVCFVLKLQINRPVMAPYF